MTDNQGLRSALEIFHMAKREAAILSKLRTAIEVHHSLIVDMAHVLKQYASWKAEYYVEGMRSSLDGNGMPIEIECLFTVKDVRLIQPEPDQFRPEFRYTIDKVIGVTSDYNRGFLAGNPINVVTNEQGRYRVIYDLAGSGWLDRLPKMRMSNKTADKAFLLRA